jgi:hypothetical protein
MSRPPLRNMFRLAHSGLEKAALACAAFGLIHATAKADERGPVEVAFLDQWSNPAAPPVHIDDAWSTQASRGAELDDGWTAPRGRRARLGEQIVAVAPVTQHDETPAFKAAPSTLANDRSGWNDAPRARSPGLIATNNAWRSRALSGADWNNAPVKGAETTPAARPAAMPDKPVATDSWSAPTGSRPASIDPWLAPQPGTAAGVTLGAASAPFNADTQWEVAGKPAAGLPPVSGSTRSTGSPVQEDLGRGCVDSARSPRAMQPAPSMQGESRKGDWSVFAGTSCLNAKKQDVSMSNTDSSQPQGQAKSNGRAAIMEHGDGFTAPQALLGKVVNPIYRDRAFHGTSVQLAQSIRMSGLDLSATSRFQANHFSS